MTADRSLNRKPTLDRFMKSFVKDKETDCWNWINARLKGGYGSIRHNNQQMRANRVSYLLFVGEIPDGMLVLHSCDNTACVNPRSFIFRKS